MLVKIEVRGICYSDLHALDGGIPFEKVPIIQGHKGAGIVEAVGSAVNDVNVGDHVGLRFVMSCGIVESKLSLSKSLSATTIILPRQMNVCSIKP